jgi:hypothetical protein
VRYFFLNALFHCLHIAVIVFVMTGWLFPPLRLAHLTLCLLTLASWFILGRWLGRGYCPVSDWHWKIKESLGSGRPDGTYIHLLLQYITGRELDSSSVDRWVVIGTLVLTGISIVLNITPLLCGAVSSTGACMSATRLL